MIHHMVLFRWKEGTTAGEVDALAAALRALPARIPAIRSYVVGADLGLSGAAAHDFAVVATFDDRAGWDEYMADTEHDRIRQEMLLPMLADRAVVQLQS
jgi:hypothetical protein